MVLGITPSIKFVYSPFLHNIYRLFLHSHYRRVLSFLLAPVPAAAPIETSIRITYNCTSVLSPVCGEDFVVLSVVLVTFVALAVFAEDASVSFLFTVESFASTVSSFFISVSAFASVNYSATKLPEHLKSGGIPPFSGCVHDTNTACLSAMQLLLLFLDFLVLLRTVPSVFRIRKDISAGY